MLAATACLKQHLVKANEFISQNQLCHLQHNSYQQMYSLMKNRMNKHRLTTPRLLLLASVLSLSACTTVNYTAQQFVPKDPGKISLLPSVAPAYQLENIEYKQADGAISRGVYIRKPGADFTVLYFMGSGVRVDANGTSFAKAFTELNANVISFDYRGFGRSDSNGKPHSLIELESDALSLYDYARKMVPGRLIVHGHSFGSFVAARLASKRAVDALVLEGTGTTALAYSDNMVPWFAKPFVKINLDEELTAVDNRAALRNYAGPVLIINGVNDVQTPAATARELFASIPRSNKRYEEVTNAGHMNAMSKPETLKAYRDFLNGQF